LPIFPVSANHNVSESGSVFFFRWQDKVRNHISIGLSAELVSNPGIGFDEGNNQFSKRCSLAKTADNVENVKFEVFAVLKIHVRAFWVMRPCCSLIGKYTS
jgi:hypothetical protein